MARNPCTHSRAQGQGATQGQQRSSVAAASLFTPRAMPTDHLKVMGMHCGHCSGRVQEILSKMPGVHAAEVDLEGCSATVHGDGVTSIAQMVAAIEAAGFEAAAASVSSCDDLTIALRVTGMHCSHCSSRVEEVLRAVGGVEEASVSLEEETATVRGSMSAHALVAAVEGAGFQAEVALPALAIPAAAASSALPPATSTRARVTRRRMDLPPGS